MDRLDVQPLNPGIRTDRNGAEPVYRIEKGRLVGPGVFYCPTGWKSYARPEGFVGAPAAYLEHFTAVHASERPLKDFDKLVARAGDRLDNEGGAIDALWTQVMRLGYIPDALSLTLQNATKDRKASWCLCCGSVPLPDGTLPVVQYSPNLDTHGTMNAGSPATWKARKKYGKKPFLTTRGETRWDGRNYRWPEVEDPETGKPRVLVNCNPYIVGVEYTLFGPMNKAKRLRYPNVPTFKVDGRYYEKPSDAMLETRAAIYDALKRAYGDDLPAWQHRDLVPHKIDAIPPFEPI